MSTQVSRAAILWAIVRKDLLEYSRERFFVVITVIGILFYALAFWLLPSSVNESFAVAYARRAWTQSSRRPWATRAQASRSCSLSR